MPSESKSKPNLVAITTCPRTGASASPNEFYVRVRPVGPTVSKKVTLRSTAERLRAIIACLSAAEP
jgi:hypothetical protein